MTTAVVGSANLDLVYRVERIPSPGETVLAVSADAVPVFEHRSETETRCGLPRFWSREDDWLDYNRGRSHARAVVDDADPALAHALATTGRVAAAKARLEDVLQKVRAAEGEGSEDYAVVLRTMAIAAFRSGDAVHGPALLEETRQRYARRGLPASHKLLAQFLRYDAGFARMRGDLATAEAKQREALAKLQASGNAMDVATARAELAQLRFSSGDRAEARALLLQALPVMRASVLPQQIDRAAAEQLARKVGT